MIDRDELRHLLIGALIIACLYYAYMFGFEDGQNWGRVVQIMRSSTREFE